MAIHAKNKAIWRNTPETIDKVQAHHQFYKQPIMIKLEQNKRFMTLRYNERTNKNEVDQVFRVENLC